MPWAVWRAVSMRVRSSNLVSKTWRCLYNEEPSHHCVTIASWGLLTHPIKSNMLTCLREERIEETVILVFKKIPRFSQYSNFIFKCLQLGRCRIRYIQGFHSYGTVPMTSVHCSKWARSDSGTYQDLIGGYLPVLNWLTRGSNLKQNTARTC